MIELAGVLGEARGAICFISFRMTLLPKLKFPVTGAEDEGGGVDEEERGGGEEGAEGGDRSNS